MTAELEVRCPINRQGMLFKLLGTPVAQIQLDNLIQITCQGCRDACRRQGRENVTAVLHYFNMLGELVRTEELPAGV